VVDNILPRLCPDGPGPAVKRGKLLLPVDARVFQVNSFDLSAATDRLPLFVQVQILAIIADPVAALAWAFMLRRPWYYRGVPYRYAVGQPMGAYSSWAMLALTHHCLVQIAAYRVGHTKWFPHYAVLGDDIVIADTAVGDSYLQLMTELGVEISLHKTIRSTTGLLEFAKRFHHRVMGDISPVSPRLLALTVRKP